MTVATLPQETKSRTLPPPAAGAPHLPSTIGNGARLTPPPTLPLTAESASPEGAEPMRRAALWLCVVVVVTAAYTFFTTGTL